MIEQLLDLPYWNEFKEEMCRVKTNCDMEGITDLTAPIKWTYFSFMCCVIHGDQYIGGPKGLERIEKDIEENGFASLRRAAMGVLGNNFIKLAQAVDTSGDLDGEMDEIQKNLSVTNIQEIVDIALTAKDLVEVIVLSQSGVVND